MRSKNILTMIGIIATFLLAGACAEHSPHKKITAGQNGNNNTDQHNARVEEVGQKIAAAVEKARREGRKSVDIHLDEIPGVVQPGDLVKISFKISLENGVKVTGEMGETKILKAGPGSVLARETLGMEVKQGKKSVIEPEEAFGLHNEENIQTFPAVRNMPVEMNIKIDDYKKQFNNLPAENDLIRITPYFKSKVIHADDQKIRILNLAENGIVRDESIGKTTISVKDNTITISLEAKKGAPFSVGKRTGRIVDADEKSFLVDFNHPYAGKGMILDLEVLSITKASEFASLELEWIDDHDRGFEIAHKNKKNKVIVLYADWCSWCKKMFSETFEDPRIKILADKFVWVKANSDIDQSLKEFYRQDGFPMIVLSDYQGKILKKMEGFKSADKLLPELEKILNLDLATAETRADN